MSSSTTTHQPPQVSQELRSKDLTFTLVGHAHIDPVWLWDWREGYETVKATFRSALDRLRENPDLVFVHSSAAHYAWMEDHPAMLAEIRDAVGRGQWEPVGGWWVEPDSNIPSGEALARQALYGQRTFERLVGRRARVAFLPDSFGHPPTFPGIFRHSGLDYFVFMRPGANEIELPKNVFWWEGPDGQKVLTVRVECYNTNPLFVDSSLERNLRWRPVEEPEWLGIFGVGNHGGGPTRAAIQTARELNDDPEWPSLRFGSLEGLLTSLAGRDQPDYQGELQHHARGCYAAHSGIKAWNRRAESDLLVAERWAAIASTLGAAYPREDLERAWKRVLFNQFHDILAGSSIEPAYRDARNELGEAISIASSRAFSSLQAIAGRVDTRRDDRPAEEAMRWPRWDPSGWVGDLGDGVPLVVFNPSPWPRHEVLDVEVNDWHTDDVRVLDDHNEPVQQQATRAESASGGRPRASFTVELPPLGYRVYRIVDETPAEAPDEAGTLVVAQNHLQNDWWSIHLDRESGAIRSLVDRKRNLEYLSGAAAQLLVMHDSSDTWGHGVTSLRHLEGAFVPERTTVVEDGPIRATIAIDLVFGESTARQEISLHRDTPQILGRLRVDWHEKHRALKLAFPTAISGVTARYAVAFGEAIRPADGQEEPVGPWMDASGVLRDLRGNTRPAGFAVLNDSKHGADIMGGELRLTVLRSPAYAHHDPAKLDPELDYKFQDQGISEMRWQIVPHEGRHVSARVAHLAHDLNTPVAFVREFAHAGELPAQKSFLNVSNPDEVMVTTLKRAEDGGDLILRLHEPYGRRASARIGMPEAGFDAEVHLAPFEIRTLRIAGGQAREVSFVED